MSEKTLQNTFSTPIKTQTELPASLDDLPPITTSSDAEELAILGDISGSMMGQRLESLRSAFKALWEITDWSACRPSAFTFHDFTNPIPFSIDAPPEIPGTAGGTEYKQALDTALNNPKLNRIIFASDGGPTDCSDEDENLPWPQIKQCQDRGIPIDTIYINEGDKEAVSAPAQILRKMSEYTGGTFALCANAAELVSQFQQLETHNRLLLTHSAGEIAGPDDVIKL